MNTLYLWFKFLHIFFVIAWFAGLFYLPRIFVNLAMCEHETEYSRLILMAKKLYRFMTPWAIGALILGLGLGHFFGLGNGWVIGKVSVGVGLAGYHYYCGILLRDFEEKRNQKSHKWYRFFNEIPVFFLLFALFCVIFKSF